MVTERHPSLHPKCWPRTIFGYFCASLVVYAIVIVLTVFLQNHLPRSHYFIYHYVSPVKVDFKVGEELQFYSTYQIRKTVDIHYSDTLYCDLYDGRGFRFFSSYDSTAVSIGPIPKKTGVWVYHGKLPNTPSACYLRTTVTAVLQYARRTQVLKAGPRLYIN